METKTNLNNVYLSYSNLNNVSIDLICKKLQKEGFCGITNEIEIIHEKGNLSVQETIKNCTYFVLIISSEFGRRMQEEYHIALKCKLNILIFVKSDLLGDEQIRRVFDDKLVTFWDDENDLSSKLQEWMAGFRYKYPERGNKFEILIEDLFKSYGCDARRTSHTYDAAYDIYAEKDGKKFYIEAKTARSKVISQQSIMSALGMADILKLKDDEYFIVVIANILPNLMKEKVKSIERFLIIDIGELLFLVQKNEKLRYRLQSIVEFTTDDIEIKEPIDFLRLFDISYKNRNILTDDKREIKQLLEKVNVWAQNKRTSVEYEKFCTQILKVLFSRDLTLWKEQQKSNDDLYRFDLICKIKDDVTSAFWKFIEDYFRTKYIIFEFKNYSEVITQREIYTTEKYLYAKALRRVAIIISCNGSDDNAKKAIKGALRENGKLILNLSNMDLANMLEYELNGNSASEYLYNILDELFIELEK